MSADIAKGLRTQEGAQRLPNILPPGLKVCIQGHLIPSERLYSAPYPVELGASLIPCLCGHRCAYPDSTRPTAPCVSGGVLGDGTNFSFFRQHRLPIDPAMSATAEFNCFAS